MVRRQRRPVAGCCLVSADRPAPGAIGFVPPRFGPEVVGGAESVVADMAQGLAGRGHQVEILTTCADDHYTWANAHQPGVTEQDRLVIRRFLTVVDTDGGQRDRIGSRILAGEAIGVREQQLWVNGSLRVPDLWHHVLDNAGRYRALIFAPYLFWTSYAVGQVSPGRTIIMPCLHDEPQARLEIFKPLIEGARGLWFLTDPEADLASEVFDLPTRTAVVGAGIDVAVNHRPAQFRAEQGIDRPFLYYAGRREWGKGWLELLDAFGELVRTHPTELLLVTSGVGNVEVPAGLADRVIDVGFLSDEQRDDAMAAATAYVQPSAMESFSRTVLEAWAAGTPVVANAESAVVKWHVERSGAGLAYRGAAELVEALRFVADEPEAMARLAVPGKAYVETSFRWSEVLDRMEHTLDQWLPQTEPVAV